MCGDGGPASAEAAALLQGAGYTNAMQLAGGYAAYTQVG
jgi:rhodanese-related sulfurtransferase